MAVLIGQAFSAADVAKLAGIAIQTLEKWVDAGILRPSISNKGERGHKRWFSFADAFSAHLAASLRKAGLSMDIARKSVDLLYTDPQWAEARTYLVIVADEARLVDRSEAERLLMRSSVAVGCDLLAAAAAFRAEIDHQMAVVAVRGAN